VTDAERRALIARVDELQEAYAQCLDGDEIERWPDFFVEKGIYRITPRENDDLALPISILSCDGQGMLHDRVFSLRHANIYAKHFYRHILGRPRWLGEGPDASERFQTNYAVFRTVEHGDTTVYSTGRYLDRVTKREGELRFAEKVAIYDNTWVDTLLVTPI
jgi:anthranilate 1,2-dioxygenase small subunit